MISSESMYQEYDPVDGLSAAVVDAINVGPNFLYAPVFEAVHNLDFNAALQAVRDMRPECVTPDQKRGNNRLRQAVWACLRHWVDTGSLNPIPLQWSKAFWAREFTSITVPAGYYPKVRRAP